jgi:probable F420-dependent oxidoreductase
MKSSCDRNIGRRFMLLSLPTVWHRASARLKYHSQGACDMRIGAIFPQNDIGPNPETVRNYVQRVESAGYHHLAIYDHVLGADVSERPDWRGPYTSETEFHEVMTLFGYCAAITSRLELVTSILILPQRQTALVAKQAAEIDLLSGGRLRIGVGLGWNHVEYESLNENFRNRGRRIEEQIQVLRLLWTQEVVSFEGRWHHIDRAGIQPLPVQRPIPIWIGAAQEPAIRRAARIGDGWFPQYGADEQGERMVRMFRQFVVEAGRDPADVPIEGRIHYADGDPERWKRELETWRNRDATHVSVVTMRAGLVAPEDHATAVERFMETARAFAD